jgi:hypothetical protein
MTNAAFLQIVFHINNLNATMAMLELLLGDGFTLHSLKFLINSFKFDYVSFTLW